MRDTTIDIRCCGISGRPLNDVFVIDAHAHMGKWFMVSTMYNEPSQIIESSDAIGINMVCVSSLEALALDFRAGNDAAIEAVKNYPDRLRAYMVVNPNQPESIIPELERTLDKPSVIGVKIHPAQHNCLSDSQGYHRVYEYMQARKGIVLSHMFEDWRCVDKLTNKYPDVSFLHAHKGGSREGVCESSWNSLLAERPNFYSDMALSTVPYRGLEVLVEKIGSEKLLFATDVPFLDNAHQIGRVIYARIDEQAKHNILGLNMKRILEEKGFAVNVQ